MRALIQRVSTASVDIDGVQVSAIGAGLLVLLGVLHDDDQAAADWLVNKVCMLRIFSGVGVDKTTVKPMNRSVIDVQGQVLVVSQFTLAADVSKGRRPGFSSAAHPEHAKVLYEYFCKAIERRMGEVHTGVFAADMQVHLTNDGPVTFMLENPARS